MGILMLVLQLSIFYETIKGTYKIGYLLLLSASLFLYTLFTMLSQGRKLTTLGIVISIISILGLIYCVCTLLGIDLTKLF